MLVPPAADEPIGTTEASNFAGAFIFERRSKVTPNPKGLSSRNMFSALDDPMNRPPPRWLSNTCKQVEAKLHDAGITEQGLPKANTGRVNVTGHTNVSRSRHRIPRRTWGSKVVHGHTLAMNDFAYSSLLYPPVLKNLVCRRGRHTKFPGPQKTENTG